MILPSRIVLKATLGDGTPAVGLIFQMTLTTGRKNPYAILFPKSDAAGVSELGAVDVKGQFTDHWQAGLMDHSGTIEDASQQAQVTLFDVAALRSHLELALAWPLLRHESTLWASRQAKVDYLLSCRNEKFLLPHCAMEVPQGTDKVLMLEVQYVA
jgi:hypothetical protein